MSASVPWLDRIAHDLRGPLSPIQTAVSLLRMGGMDAARQNELLEMIDRQTRLLGHMIGELGDWSRAAQGTLLGERRPCSPAALLDNAISGARSGLQVEDASGRAMVDGDEWRLCQLLRILVDYLHARGSDASLSMHAEGDCLLIALQALMAETVRLTLLTEPAPEPHDGGLGLNLLIARAIVEAHGGSLTAEQDSDGLLRVHCALPLARL
jgi:signal transduction histidine kinase